MPSDYIDLKFVSKRYCCQNSIDRLTSRIMRPTLIVWKTLEENVKEDGRKGDSQTSECKVIGNLHL